MPNGDYLAFAAGFDARGLWLGLITGLTVAAVLLLRRFYLESRGEIESSVYAYGR